MMKNVKTNQFLFNIILILLNYMKTTVSILGKNVSVFILFAIILFTVFTIINTADSSQKCNKSHNHGHNHEHNHGHSHGHSHGDGGCCKTACDGTCKKCNKRVRFASNVKNHDGPNYTPFGYF